MSDIASALQKLANYRQHNARASQEVFSKGSPLLKNNAAHVLKLGDEAWAFLEQLTLAALDVDRIDVADRCLQLLNEKFPGSPRVECLEGIRIEATEPADVALRYYEDLLQADSANAAAWKRQISVLRRTGKVERAVRELSSFLDTFYTDVEGWLELADIYATCNQYTYALQALAHVLLLAPQNPFYVLQAAETAYTAGDVSLATRYFLIVIDMTTPDDSAHAPPPPEGITVRAWYGVKLCTRRLASEPRLAATSPSSTAAPSDTKLLNELATEQLRTAYSKSGIRDDILGWIDGA